MSRRSLVRIVGIGTFLFIACSSVVVLRAGGEYNLNPSYCRDHLFWDPPWWDYQCWLPDPPPNANGG